MKRRGGGKGQRRVGRPTEAAIERAREREQSRRPALGREKTLGESDDSRWLGVVLDAIQRHRATRDPLDKVYAGLSKAQRLGASERRRGQNVLFTWTRSRAPLEAFIQKHIKQTGGIRPRVRDIDRVALYLCIDEEERASLPPITGPLAPLFDDEVRIDAGFPPWLNKELKRFEDADALRAAMLERAPVTLCVPDVDAHSDILAAFEETGREVRRARVHSALESTGRVARDDMHRIVGDAGWPMDAGSQFVGHLVAAAAKGQPVLDLCCGGGGKSLLLARLGVPVVGVDIDAQRLKNAKLRIAGQGPHVFVHADGKQLPVQPASFQAVLVDAPCSGTGTIRRAPDVMFRVDQAAIDAHHATQCQLLRAGLRAAANDGVVIYVTCSLMRRENEAVVETVIAAGDAEPVKLASLGYTLPFEFDADATHVTLRPDRHGTDGFFVAALKPLR